MLNQDMRRKAKAINFGIIYGISQYGLAKQIMVSNNEAEEFLNSYFLKFPEIKEYMKKQLNFVEKVDMLIIYLEEELILKELMIKILMLEIFKKELL